MKLLYGTGNLAKLAAMRSRLEKLDIELIGLNDLKAKGYVIPKVVENGNTPLENARVKARAYYEAFKMPVFSCDSGLYFDNVPDSVQPGVHVRNVNGKSLSDEEMLAYYGNLVKRYGNLIARYKNAICLVLDENHIYEAMDSSMESEKFILTDKPYSAVRKKGFPLDSISIDIKTNQYYYDLPVEKLEQVAVEDGFLLFFEKILKAETKEEDAMLIREARENDLDEILQLYLHLHEKSVPQDSEQLRSTWNQIMKDTNHHLIVCEVEGKIAASCVCVIIPNLTRNVSPYAFIENVVTHEAYRKKGYATACLNFARQIAKENHCYKMMLLTGSKEESTLHFYQNAGYNSADKTAFIQWIDE